MRSVFFLLSLCAMNAMASVTAEVVNYPLGQTQFRSYLAYNEIYLDDQRPGILLIHDGWGLDATIRRRADMLAAEGYVVLAADMYGRGLYTDNARRAELFRHSLLQDTAAVEQRFSAALQQLRNNPLVDPQRVAALGYGMGGRVALHMARLGSPLNGVVSFHGLLPTGAIPARRPHQPRILMFVGQDDPLIPGEAIADFKEAMHAAGFPFQLVTYPDTLHAFTQPLADRMAKAFGKPYAYNPAADRDAWEMTGEFLNRVFWQ